MAYYKVTFYTRPKLERFPDNPPSETIRYYEGDSAPSSSDLVMWHEKNLQHDGPKNVTAKVVEISKVEFDKKGKYDEIFL
ncbi:MAG: hypothetical protein KIS94_09905 [Chitinophagales bacterium]|nr:hypothetical protein [Chitinophagales bacterium]